MTNNIKMPINNSKTSRITMNGSSNFDDSDLTNIKRMTMKFQFEITQNLI